ncbi:MAG: hypothetical protein WC551_07225 [Patescibacteria group bacterium]
MNSATRMLSIVRKIESAVPFSIRKDPGRNLFTGCINCGGGHLVLIPEKEGRGYPDRVKDVPEDEGKFWLELLKIIKEEGLDAEEFLAELRERHDGPGDCCVVGSSKWFLDWIAARID